MKLAQDPLHDKLCLESCGDHVLESKIQPHIVVMDCVLDKR
jgi:hypothetical protein